MSEPKVALKKLYEVPFMREETITPEEAQKNLDNMAINRPLSRDRIARYADDMRKGRWRTTSQGLSKDWFGRTLNGVHRMKAIIAAGIPVKFVVYYGEDPANFESMDTGKQRTAGDFIALRGVPNPTRTKAILNIVEQLATGQSGSSFTMDHVDERMAVFGEGVRWAASLFITHKSYDTAPIAGALAFAYATDPEAVQLFAIGLREGGLPKTDPATLLREYAMEKASTHGKTERRDLAMKTLTACAAALDGREFQRLHASDAILNRFKKAYPHIPAPVSKQGVDKAMRTHTPVVPSDVAEAKEALVPKPDLATLVDRSAATPLKPWEKQLSLPTPAPVPVAAAPETRATKTAPTPGFVIRRRAPIMPGSATA